MITAATKKFLENHLEERLSNHQWVAPCLEGKADAFPYRPDAKGSATLSAPFSPSRRSTARVTPPDSSRALFLANIPMVRLPSDEIDYSSYTTLLNRLRDESFGVTNARSSAKVKERLAVVVGINQIESIDAELNRTFGEFIKELPVVESVVNRSIGFLWKPEWRAKQKNVYPLKKAFLLLKALSAKQAAKVRKTHEQPKGLAPSIVSQIPFQSIRETIKNCRATRTFMDQMEEAAPEAPIYYTTMDADCLSLRPTQRQQGIFSRYEQVINDNDQPSIVSLGYSLASDEAPLLRLAVKMDMAVRSTMPMPYFPEPCSGYKVRNPEEENFLSFMSFLGRGNGLESRRFIENGRKKLTDGAVFKADGGVVTTAPTRMKTVYNQKIQTLTPAVLKKKPSLQALRGRTIQTHAFPKQWADILYAGLPFSCARVTDATAPMMHIFSVYDPISRMFNASRYTSAVFDREMRNYDDPLTDGQKATLKTARARLLNLKMKKEMVDLVEETAKRSGQAIHQVLTEALQS